MKKKYWLLVSIFFYAAALLLPALYGGGSSQVGWVVLLLGAFKIPGAECLAWLANPLFFIAVFCFGFNKLRAAFSLSLCAAAIGLDTFRLSGFPLDAGGFNVPVTSVGPAFYVWMLSFLVLAGASANESFKPVPLRGAA